MKNLEPLECLECGKQLYKRVCFLKIGDEFIADEYGRMELNFCSKPCAFKWIEKNKSVEYFDVEEVQENNENK